MKNTPAYLSDLFGQNGNLKTSVNPHLTVYESNVVFIGNKILCSVKSRSKQSTKNYLKQLLPHFQPPNQFYIIFLSNITVYKYFPSIQTVIPKIERSLCFIGRDHKNKRLFHINKKKTDR